MHWKVPGPKKLQVALEWQGLVFSRHWLIGVHDESSSPIWNPSAHSPATKIGISKCILFCRACMDKHNVFSTPKKITTFYSVLICCLWRKLVKSQSLICYFKKTRNDCKCNVVQWVAFLSHFVSKKHCEYLKKATTQSAEKCIRYTSQLFNGYWPKLKLSTNE